MPAKDDNWTRMKEAAERARTTAMLRHIAYHRTPKFKPHLKPHTFVFLRGRSGRISDCMLLGLIFQVWPKGLTHIRITHEDLGTGDKWSAVGQFCRVKLPSGKVLEGERGLVVDERWAWDSLLFNYRGLAAGDL